MERVNIHKLPGDMKRMLQRVLSKMHKLHKASFYVTNLVHQRNKKHETEDTRNMGEFIGAHLVSGMLHVWVNKSGIVVGSSFGNSLASSLSQ